MRSPPPLFDRRATWKDIRQLAWSVMLVLPFLAIGTFGLASLVGTPTALWVAGSLVLFVTAAFVLIVLMCVLGSYGYELLALLRRRRESRTGAQ